MNLDISLKQYCLQERRMFELTINGGSVCIFCWSCNQLEWLQVI